MAKITFQKLQHIYDLHAGDFGLSGNKNMQQLHRLEDVVQAHLEDVATTSTRGQYRGNPARIFYNPRTQNVVVLDEHEKVLAGFKASDAQLGYIISTGRLS